ncbi:hypothetical protein U1Q18_048220 [Sarracenia purpurea var. burkii]
MARNQMDWGTFARKVKSCQRGFMGEPEEMRPGRGEFYEYPSSCICQKPFKYADLKNSNDKYRTSKAGTIVPETNDKGMKSLQRLNESSVREGLVPLAEEIIENGNFLPG